MTDVGATAGTQALDSLNASGTPVNQILAVALHTSTEPTVTTAANENANTGSYARQSCGWNAASGTTKTNSSSLTFSTAGTVPIPSLAGWSSATYGAGNKGIGAALGSSVTAASITVAGGAISLAVS
jgi:hypothetical protein